MKRESMLYGLVGLLVGLLVAGGAATLSVNNDYRGMMRMMGMNTSRVQDESVGHMGMSMNGMQAELQDETGDDFDENFISMMIAHHQGAINMAYLAQNNAKHQEIKDLADDIIAAQSKEIDMMKGWQTNWGYDADASGHMMR